MNLRHAFVLLLCAFGCSSSSGTGGATGSVTFSWDFNSASCTDANVDVVQVEVAGNTTTWSCWDPVNQVQGATVLGVPTGTQPFTLTGFVPTYDSSTGAYKGDVAWYAASGTAQVVDSMDTATGTITLTYITPPPSSSASNIGFIWTFSGQDCTQTPMVDHLLLDIGGESNRYPCSTGGVFANQSAGAYPFSLVAYDVSGNTLYQSGGTATVDGVNSININTDLQPMVLDGGGTGNAEVDFTFGTSAQNCSQVGVDTLHYALTDPTGTVVPGTDLMQPCGSASSPSVGIAYSSLQPAVYYLYIQGYTGANVSYQLSGYQFTAVASPTTSTYQTVLLKTN